MHAFVFDSSSDLSRILGRVGEGFTTPREASGELWEGTLMVHWVNHQPDSALC